MTLTGRPRVTCPEHSGVRSHRRGRLVPSAVTPAAVGVSARWLLTWLAVVLMLPHGAAQALPPRQFLRAEGDKLYEGAREFRFVSFNLPNLHLVEDNFAFQRPHPWRWPDPFEIEDALESIRQLSGKVVRTYVISVQRTDSDMGAHVHVRGPGDFNEEAFQVLDRVLKIASEKGLRVIVPLVDNWHWWGGAKEYARFRGQETAEFWTDRQLIEDFKQTVAFVVNRRNTLTGITYNNDPTIFGWETGNELDSPQSWTSEIAAYIKSLDANHLVIDGNSLHGIRQESLDDPQIDVVTSHHYPSINSAMLPSVRQACAAAKGHKPYFVGEIGFIETREMEQILQTVQDSGLSGALLWSLRFHRREGGFYWHSEGAGGNVYKAYHWPGFESGAAYDERALLRLVRRFAHSVDGRTELKLSPPQAPRLLPIPSPATISWQGSAGAASYDIERATLPEGPWQIVGRDISDAFSQYRPLFTDESADPGGSYYYRVAAKNEAGNSPPSNIVGPVRSHTKHVVDELSEIWSSPLVSRSIVGEAQWLTDSARPVQEDIHRLSVRNGGSVTYESSATIRRGELHVFCQRLDALDLEFSVSTDGQTFRPVEVTVLPFRVSGGDYGYWHPTLVSIDLGGDRAARFLRIAAPKHQHGTDSATQLSRLEIVCQAP